MLKIIALQFYLISIRLYPVIIARSDAGRHAVKHLLVQKRLINFRGWRGLTKKHQKATQNHKSDAERANYNQDL